jgi:uncharacterized protein YcaQ
MPTPRLPLNQARRVAIAAQGLDRHRPPEPGARHLAVAMDRLALLQVDSVLVVVRAHLVPLFSRLGPYDRSLVTRAIERPPRRLLETWAHEASLVRPDVYHLLEWRRAGADEYAWGRMRRIAAEHPEIVAEVRAAVGAHGPMTARQTRAALGHAHDRSTEPFGSWDWGPAKSALEYLFWTGEVACPGRTAQFERRYDLAERVVPPAGADIPRDHASQQRRLIEIAAQALGVATPASLADYFRMPTDLARAAIAGLVADGVLEPVSVEGWTQPAYLHREARTPRSVHSAALLSPFDSMIFDRRRLEELFAMRHRLEYYVPPQRRIWGYYVMPFLLGEEMVARVDLKADRAASRLIVRAVHLEPGQAVGQVGAALAAEVAELAVWLGLNTITLDDAAGALAPWVT